MRLSIAAKVIREISRGHFSIAKWFCFSVFLISAIMVGGVYLAEAAPVAQSVEEGQAIFQQKCASCHTIGGGARLGPDLKGVTSSRDRDWLVRWITEPDKLIAQGDPIATQLLRQFNNIPMPNVGLSKAEANAVLAYLATQSGGTQVAQPTPASNPPVTSSDPVIGKKLFTGEVRFQNGGPPCLACHSIAGIGALGGGTLGPDLTQTYTKFGEAGVSSILATLPFPTMNPIFSNRPLTPEEQANLGAFLQQTASAERSTQGAGLLALLGVAGAIVLLLLAQLFWRRRLAGVRRPLVESEGGKQRGVDSRPS